MDALLLLMIVLVNVLISIWNCYAVGTAWKDTMTIGGWFNKLVLWSAVIQSGIGFSMPILIAVVWGLTTYLTSGNEPTLTPIEGEQFMEAIFSLWYVIIIFPLLGSALAVWAHSLREAYRRRDFTSIATAGWNTYAQIRNTLSAINNIGGALGNVGQLLREVFQGRSEFRVKLAIFGIVIAIGSLIAGFLIAIALVRYFSEKTESRIETYAAKRLART